MNSEYHRLRDKADRLYKEAQEKVTYWETRFESGHINEEERSELRDESERLYAEARICERKAAEVLKEYNRNKYLEIYYREQTARQKDYEADQAMYSELRRG